MLWLWLWCPGHDLCLLLVVDPMCLVVLYALGTAAALWDSAHTATSRLSVTRVCRYSDTTRPNPPVTLLGGTARLADSLRCLRSKARHLPSGRTWHRLAWHVPDRRRSTGCMSRAYQIALGQSCQWRGVCVCGSFASSPTLQSAPSALGSCHGWPTQSTESHTACVSISE
jgi:hypothetical protein